MAGDDFLISNMKMKFQLFKQGKHLLLDGGGNFSLWFVFVLNLEQKLSCIYASIIYFASRRVFSPLFEL